MAHLPTLSTDTHKYAPPQFIPMDGNGRMPLRVPGRLPLAYVVLGVFVAFAVGLATGAGITVTNGAAETGGAGTTHTGAWLAFWDQIGALEHVTTPATPPALVSTTDGSPTVLPGASTSYMIDAGTAGHAALEWVFNETKITPFPTNNEVMVTFTISTGAGPTITTIVAFVETQGTPPPIAGLQFTFYWDSGSAGAISLNFEEQVSQFCSGGAGTC